MSAQIDCMLYEPETYIPPDKGVPYSEEEFEEIKGRILKRIMDAWEKSNKMLLENEEDNEKTEGEK